MWKEIPGFAGRYEASSEGLVRSWHTNGRGKPGRRREPWSMSGCILPGGYRQVRLAHPTEGPTCKLVHVLVLETFVGPCPPGKEGAHLDGNPRNNKLSNLAWVTHEENMHQAVAHGTAGKGNRKLGEPDVAAILVRRAEGATATELAAEFSVSRGHVYHLLNGTRRLRNR